MKIHLPFFCPMKGFKSCHFFSAQSQVRLKWDPTSKNAKESMLESKLLNS
jgi:hypothetical protein